MFFPFGNFNDRVKVYQAFFEPFRVSLEHRVCAGRARVTLTAYQCRVQLGSSIAGNEPWLFETENVSKKPAFNVGGET